ncbi:AfsA-related hotdog domain-containing protein [Kineosporia succinea]|uniref:A-factor biosynthesis hotdog domain-containing protein n=1 Tax=Kineosporia succinea TaxID=84632 RepID=A0ABT9P6U5_9ACTN|nr:AfsA-related hotdog domain-containing protein [Kineosporia succinea]MDP9828430.1 hypothetical protein [Kineosporia succinea]
MQAEASPEALTDQPLLFSRTVDRQMIHRAAVSEVFVTDVRAVTDRLCRVGVQLPCSHSYYSDHCQDVPLADVLLVLEACRQAAIGGAHVVTGIPVGESMLVNRFEITVGRPELLRLDGDPLDLTLSTRYLGEPRRSGRVRNGGVEQNVFLGDVEIGRHTMDVTFVRGSQHAALRRVQRGSEPPSTRDLDVPDPSGQASPLRVGRLHPHNVVLTDPVERDGLIGARVTPHPGNRGLFDHAYDHLPAMTLTEAARQIALAGHRECLHAAGFRAVFHRFAELDAPVTVTAPTGASRPGPAGAPRHVEVPCLFEQDGELVAEITVTLTTVEFP